MNNEQKNVYEGLFLFSHGATGNLQEASDHVRDLLSRAGTEVVSFRRWDERKLAFDIKGNKRGVYFLVYFNAPPESMPVLERDCNLSEQILRSMITRADHLTPEQIEAADGTQDLADEIKLRSEEAAAAEAGPTATVRETSTAVAPPPASDKPTE